MISPISPTKLPSLFPKSSPTRKEDIDLPVFPSLLVISPTTCIYKRERFTNGALAVSLKTALGAIVCAITWLQETDPFTSTFQKAVTTRSAIVNSQLMLLSAVTPTDWSSNITITPTEVSTNSGVKSSTGSAGDISFGTSPLKRIVS